MSIYIKAKIFIDTKYFQDLTNKYKIETNKKIKLWQQESEVMDFAIDGIIGFKQNQFGEIEAHYDDMYKQNFINFMADYYTNFMSKNIQGFNLLNKELKDNKLILRLEAQNG